MHFVKSSLAWHMSTSLASHMRMSYDLCREFLCIACAPTRTQGTALHTLVTITTCASIHARKSEVGRDSRPATCTEHWCAAARRTKLPHVSSGRSQRKKKEIGKVFIPKALARHLGYLCVRQTAVFVSSFLFIFFSLLYFVGG